MFLTRHDLGLPTNVGSPSNYLSYAPVMSRQIEVSRKSKTRGSSSDFGNTDGSYSHRQAESTRSKGIYYGAAKMTHTVDENGAPSARRHRRSRESRSGGGMRSSGSTVSAPASAGLALHRRLPGDSINNALPTDHFAAAASFFVRASQRSTSRHKKQKRLEGSMYHNLHADHAKFATRYLRIVSFIPPVASDLLNSTAQNGVTFRQVGTKISVHMRVSRTDWNGKNTHCIEIDASKRQLTLIDPLKNGYNSQSKRFSASIVPKFFAFDGVHTCADTPLELASTVLVDLINAVVNGTDATLLCFGHERVGQSESVYGSESEPSRAGLIPCAIAWLFQSINLQKQTTGARFSVRVSAVEVHGKEERLKDLLADVTKDDAVESAAPGIYLREDPISGTQLENQSEMRAPTAEQAAYYLDAALAARTAGAAGTDSAAATSHVLYTLHVYQYRVQPVNTGAAGTGINTANSGGGGVSGGRSRLHIFDLGGGRRGGAGGGAEQTPNGGASKRAPPTAAVAAPVTALSLSALGNVVLALITGQRHVPNRGSKLAQLLKETIDGRGGHRCCVVGHVSAEVHHYHETLQVLHLAAKIYRVKRKKNKVGKATSEDSSSCDSFGGRRVGRHRPRMGTFKSNGSQRHLRSASDMECTSSSEQSCDTVIYTGNHAELLSATDGEGGSSVSFGVGGSRCPSDTASDRCYRGGGCVSDTAADTRYRGGISASGGEDSDRTPTSSPQFHRAGLQRLAPRTNAKVWPRITALGVAEALRNQQEQWIDGPNAVQASALSEASVHDASPKAIGGAITSQSSISTEVQCIGCEGSTGESSSAVIRNTAHEEGSNSYAQDHNHSNEDYSGESCSSTCKQNRVLSDISERTEYTEPAMESCNQLFDENGKDRSNHKGIPVSVLDDVCIDSNYVVALRDAEGTSTERNPVRPIGHISDAKNTNAFVEDWVKKHSAIVLTEQKDFARNISHSKMQVTLRQQNASTAPTDNLTAVKSAKRGSNLCRPVSTMSGDRRCQTTFFSKVADWINSVSPQRVRAHSLSPVPTYVNTNDCITANKVIHHYCENVALCEQKDVKQSDSLTSGITVQKVSQLNHDICTTWNNDNLPMYAHKEEIPQILSPQIQSTSSPSQYSGRASVGTQCTEEILRDDAKLSNGNSYEGLVYSNEYALHPSKRIGDRRVESSPRRITSLSNNRPVVQQVNSKISGSCKYPVDNIAGNRVYPCVPITTLSAEQPLCSLQLPTKRTRSGFSFLTSPLFKKKHPSIPTQECKNKPKQSRKLCRKFRFMQLCKSSRRSSNGGTGYESDIVTTRPTSQPHNAGSAFGYIGTPPPMVLLQKGRGSDCSSVVPDSCKSARNCRGTSSGYESMFRDSEVSSSFNDTNSECSVNQKNIKHTLKKTKHKKRSRSVPPSCNATPVHSKHPQNLRGNYGCQDNRPSTTHPAVSHPNTVAVSRIRAYMADSNERLMHDKIQCILHKQEFLKNEFRKAKQLIGADVTDMDHMLTASSQIFPSQEVFIQALTLETRALERRVQACKSRISITTCFDGNSSIQRR